MVLCAFGMALALGFMIQKGDIREEELCDPILEGAVVQRAMEQW